MASDKVGSAHAVLLGCICLLFLGFSLLLDLPFDWIPAAEGSEVTVVAEWPGISPETLAKELVPLLEQSFLQISGVTGVEMVAQEGRVLAKVSWAGRLAEGVAMTQILDRLASVESSFEGQVRLSVLPYRFESLDAQEGFFTIQLVGPIPPDKLRSLAEEDIAHRFLKLPGIASIEARGGEQRELRATLAQVRSASHSALVTKVYQRLFGALRDRGYGTLPADSRRTLLYRAGRRDLPSLRSLPLGSDPQSGNAILRLGDIGRLELTSAPLRSISRIDGHPVVTLTLKLAPDSHLLRVAEDVRRVVEETRGSLPRDTQLLIADDQSEDVRRRLRDLVVRGALGFLLLLGVLLTMLRSGRAVAVVVFVVLVSLATAVILFKPLGLGLNVLTIAGLVLLLGLLVDNAVVVVERLQVERTSSPSVDRIGDSDAARRAVKAVWLPLLGGTFSTCAVFLPMVYLSGELRNLFSSFAVLSSLTLCFSLVASVVLIPNLARILLRGGTPPRISGAVRNRALLMPYRLAARHPFLTFVLVLFAIGLPTPLVPERIDEPPEGWQSEADRNFAARFNRTLGSERCREARQWLDPLLGGITRPFLENIKLGKRWDFPERPMIKVWIELPVGSSIERTDERIRPFEEEARRSTAVKRTLVHVSGRTARMTVLFHDDAMGGSEPYLLRERLIAQGLQVAGMEVSVSGLLPTGFYTGLGRVSGFTVYALGPTYVTLEEISNNFARRLERNPRVAEVDINATRGRQPPAREVIRFHWGAEAVARTGLRARELAAVLRPQLWRETPDFYADLQGNPRLPVRIVTEGAKKIELGTLLHRPLAAGIGGPVRLADHATISVEKDPPIIERIDQQYRRTLRVFYRGTYRMGRKMLKKEVAGLVLPPGYRLEQPSYEFFDTSVKRQFFWLILATVGLVFLVIAAVLESWHLAAVVMLSVPISWIGIASAFLWTGQNFAEGAFIGIVLTIGITVNDAILLADRYRRLRLARPATPVDQLASSALRQRLRPMWTTTLTSIAGMLPLVVIPNAGNFWVGLALTVVGGLLSSTVLAPAAILALLSWRARRLREHDPCLIERGPVA